MKEGLLEQIQSRGYWRVSFVPTVFKERLDIDQCQEIVEKNSVSLRGWNFPHIARQISETSGFVTYDKYFENWTDWQGYKEFWQMYQSGQFLSYNSLHEDWFDERKSFLPPGEKIASGTKFNIIGSGIYQITEFFEFLYRLVLSDLYKEGVIVSISLNNTESRELWLSDPMRASLSENYISGSKKLEFTKEFSPNEITEKSRDIAIDCMVYFFKRFGWKNAPIALFKSEQEKLMNGLF